MATETKTGIRVLGLAKPVEENTIKVYDFKRPDKFSKEQIVTVSIMHETFARLAAARLSALLSALAHVHVVSVDQLTFEEFIQVLPSPNTMAIIRMEPLKGTVMLQIDPPITFSIIDRLFGGSGKTPIQSRDLTDIEFSIFSGLLSRLLEPLRESWAQILDIQPRLGQIESNPQFAQIVRPTEMIVLVTFAVKIGEVEGLMNLVLPYITIEPIVPRLSAQYWYMSNQVNPGDESEKRKLIAAVETSVDVSYEGEKLTLYEIIRLKPGSLVAIKGYAEGRAYLHSGGTVLCPVNVKKVSRREKKSYEIVAEGKAAEWLLSAQGTEPRSQEGADRFADALVPLVHEMAETRKLFEQKITVGLASLSQKQDAISDQMIFAPSLEELSGVQKDAQSGQPFAFTRRFKPSLIATFIQQEHPQLIALILAYLERHTASSVLGMLPLSMQSDVIERIALMCQSAPEVLREVERVLQVKLSSISTNDFIASGGVESVAEILNHADRSTEKYIVETLEKTNPVLAEEIKQRMFVFEDIVLLDPSSIAKVIAKVTERAETDMLLFAMKACQENVKNFIWNCIPKKDVEKLKARFEEIGRIRLNEADSAQQKMVALIREMDESGEIIVARPEDTTI